jgi:predicted DNA-binding transcriptional regulator YafY
MKNLSDATEHREKRRIHLRKILQRAGTPMATEELHEELVEWSSSKVYPRNTRRDLAELAEAGLLIGLPKGSGPNRRSKYWALGRGSFDLALSPEESMTLTAIFQHAERFGFWATSDELTKLRDYAAGEIRSHSAQRLIADGRISTGTRFTVLQPGKYRPAHLALIQKAMIDGRSLKVHYNPRGSGGIECTYLLKPLALAYQDSNVYLSAFVAREEWHGAEPSPDATRGKYSSNGPGTTCALMLHRMLNVTMAREDVPEPANYDVRSPNAQRDLMTVHADEPIDLELRLRDNLHNRLTENALAADQVVEREGARWLLRCKILDTQGLRLFLLSNAADIEVIAPSQLRDHIRGELKDALAQYAD